MSFSDGNQVKCVSFFCNNLIKWLSLEGEIKLSDWRERERERQADRQTDRQLDRRGGGGWGKENVYMASSDGILGNQGNQNGKRIV